MQLRARIVVCLMAVFPVVAAAQVDAPVSGPSVPQGEFIPHRLEPEKSFPSGPRFVAEALVGTALGAGGGALGFLLGKQLTDCDVFDDVCDGGQSLAVLGPSLLGVELLSSLSVYGVGTLLDGRGTLLSALEGGAVGTGLGLLSSAFVGYGAFLVTPPLAALGALIAFELSDSSMRSPRGALALGSGGIEMIPVFGTTPKGGLLGGLVGHF